MPWPTPSANPNATNHFTAPQLIGDVSSWPIKVPEYVGYAGPYLGVERISSAEIDWFDPTTYPVQTIAPIVGVLRYNRTAPFSPGPGFRSPDLWGVLGGLFYEPGPAIADGYGAGVFGLANRLDQQGTNPIIWGGYMTAVYKVVAPGSEPTGACVGVLGAAQKEFTGTLGDAIGVDGQVSTATNGGTITHAVAVRANYLFAAPGVVVTRNEGVEIVSPQGAGTIENLYGLYVQPQLVGTVESWNLYSEGATSKAKLEGRLFYGVPNAAAADADLGDNELTAYLDEAANLLTFRVRYSDTTLHTGTVDLSGATPGALPAGMIVPFGGAAAPTGWLLCDGSAVSRATYAGLFAVLGTTYGPGDGSTTFNLPNLSDRFPIGSGTVAMGAAAGALGHDHSTPGLTHAGTAVANHVVTQPAAHVVTQPAAHVVTQPAAHVVTQPAAHVVTQPADHAVGAVGASGTAAVKVGTSASNAAASGHTHPAPTVDAHSGTAVDAHSGTAVDAHSGTAVDAHSGTAVDAHSGTAVDAHGVTQPGAHAAGTTGTADPPYLGVAYIIKT